jgi:acyl carrier protein
VESLEHILAAIFKVNPEVLSDTSTIGDLDGWDSLSHMNLIAELESRYNVELTGDEIAGMQSVAAIKTVLKAKGVAL